jgi:hypothetical protein
MSAAHFGVDQKTLWLLTKQENSGVGGAAVVKQVQMGEYVCRRRLFLKREASSSPCQSEKRFNFLAVEVI